MNAPLMQADKPNGVPIGRLIVIFGVIGVIGIVYLGARQIISAISFVKIPVVGEWRAASKPWRILFLPDKTVVSSTLPSQSAAAQTWTSAPGTYWVDYAGTLWVKLDTGESYTTTLSAETPNRFDLIDSRTESVTVFERAPAPTPNPSDALKKPPG